MSNWHPDRPRSGSRVGRSRSSAKAAGAKFERDSADYLATALNDPRIDRKTKTGAEDTGDIANVMAHEKFITVECKDRGGAFYAAEWMAEAEAERINDGGLAAIVVAKRKGVTDPSKQWVLMTAGELVALMTGNRDHLGESHTVKDPMASRMRKKTKPAEVVEAAVEAAAEWVDPYADELKKELG